MLWNVLDLFLVGDNTSITIKGNGNGLKNGMVVFDENNIAYNLLSVATLSGEKPDDIGKRTVILIEGKFKSNIIKF